MIPINQTQFAGQGVGGNCVQACVASLLELPVEDVPHFLEIAASPDEWELAYEDWLESRGLVNLRFEYHHIFEGFYLATGPSVRGVNHMTVFYDGELAHDPHPSKSGLVQVTRTRILVPRDIARWIGPAHGVLGR